MSIKIKKYGFTMIEIIFVMLIVAMLALIAIPNVQMYLNRTKTDSAAQVMLQDAQFLHKWQTIVGGYYVNKKTNGKCPYLPFDYESQNDNSHTYYITSSDANLMGKIGTSSSKLLTSTCYVNNFTLKAYPICGTSTEKSGVICLDQDGNVTKNADQNCNPRTDSSQIICVDDQTKDSNRDNNPPDVNPPAPPGPTPTNDPAEYCSQEIHSGDLTCRCLKKDPTVFDGACVQPVYCMEHPTQPQCKCVLHPNDPNCPGYCNTTAGKNDKACPGWCDVDLSRKTDPYCDTESGGDIPSSCIDNPNREICEDQCKFQSPRADWCDSACAKITVNPPDWCNNTPPPDPYPYNVGDTENDVCGNTYVCKDRVACKNYTPDSSNSSQAWTLQSCSTPAGSTFFEAGHGTYALGSQVNTSSCLAFKCNNPNGCSESVPSNVATTVLENSQWIPCYNLCPKSMASYSLNSYSFDMRCSNVYQCIGGDKCNDLTGTHQPGNEMSTDRSVAWRQIDTYGGS